MKRITYDKTRFKPVMVALDVYKALKDAKRPMDSFTDVIRRLVKYALNRDIEWSVVRPVQPSVKDFYGSELFA